MIELCENAAKNGYLEAFEYIVTKLKSPTPLKNRDLLDSDLTGKSDSQIFNVAVRKGDLPVVKYLMEHHPQKCRIDHKHAVLYAAACEGNLPLIKLLIDEDPSCLDNMTYLTVLSEASDNNNWLIVEYLIDNHSKVLHSATDKQYMDIFSLVVHDEHIKDLVIKLRPNLFISDDPYLKAFYRAASKNDLPTMEFLVAEKPNILNIRDSAYYVNFVMLAKRGKLATLQYFIAKIPPTEQDIGEVTCNAISHYELETANYLLSFTSGLTHAEAHDVECKHYVYPYIDKLLNHLHEQKTKFEQEHPNTVFNEVNPEQAKVYLCCLRNLIRRNEPTHLNEMVFLLDIPAVKALTHTSIAPNQPNELLRLALSLSNEGTARLLLNIPAVHALAEQNQFYRDEAQGQFNLENLAQDRESSMLALAPGEQKRMKRVEDHYSAEMQTKGVPNLMNELKMTLTTRYEKNPAFIVQMKEGKKQYLNLPLQWDDFQKLKLSPVEHQLALSAYYKNKDHGAFRYLSKPNPWMHARASYVNVNPENTVERWSTFNEYQPLIALLYLAATDDKKDMVMDGYTAETRFDQFVDEL